MYPNEKGEITLRNLAPGRYQLVTRLFANYWYPRSITLPASNDLGSGAAQTRKSIDAVSNWTMVRQGQHLSGMVVTLSEGASSFQGQVVLSEGQALPSRLYVYLVPIEPEKEHDLLRFFAAPVSAERKITLNNIAPGRYWIVARPALEGPPALTQLRLLDEKETRSRLRREAEAENREIEFKPYQNVIDYQLPLNPHVSTLSTPNQ